MVQLGTWKNFIQGWVQVEAQKSEPIQLSRKANQKRLNLTKCQYILIDSFSLSKASLIGVEVHLGNCVKLGKNG